ncbi:MAG: helix-turn-helix domain-containing protein [Desulfurellales bacterium]|nr:MAG: helix-turn-helix domain-containing protein [Desulfurellales bacterium]
MSLQGEAITIDGAPASYDPVRALSEQTEPVQVARNDDPYWRAHTQAEVLTIVRAGFSRTAAARKVQISRNTISAWCEKYPEFAAALREAETVYRRDTLEDLVRKAAETDWRAADRMLQVMEAGTWRKLDAAAGGTTVNIAAGGSSQVAVGIQGPTTAFLAEVLGGGGDEAREVAVPERPVLPSGVLPPST